MHKFFLERTRKCSTHSCLSTYHTTCEKHVPACADLPPIALLVVITSTDPVIDASVMIWTNKWKRSYSLKNKLSLHIDQRHQDSSSIFLDNEDSSSIINWKPLNMSLSSSTACWSWTSLLYCYDVVGYLGGTWRNLKFSIFNHYI
jgi:hypothetical protein